MSLRYALMALLTAGPVTGYDAAKRFSGSVGHVWHAPDSQIYPELRRMQTDGLIEGEQVRWGPRSTKTRYHLTEIGLDDFRRWMSTPPGHAAERDVHRMQAAYLEWTDPEHALAILREHVEYFSEQVDMYTAIRDGIEARTDPAIIRRLETRPESEHDRIVAYKVFSYSGMIARARSEIEWATAGIELVRQLEAADSADGSTQM
ncbi:PadR family transcriptional regulator [Rhodococcus fascians]|nr:PadR family transcriptional regulator [Rhodococcus fascians]